MPWNVTNVMNQRIEFALRALRTVDFRGLCREYGISAKTGYKWRERFLRRGWEGMQEGSRRPLSSPQELSEGVVCEMVRLKQRHPFWGPRKIRAVYGRMHEEVPSESSFKRVLKRAGWTEKRRVRSAGVAGRLMQGRRAQAPNEVWTVDFKGWWYEADGRRCEPLTVRDEFSRFVLELRVMPRADTQTVRGSMERLFERYGLPEVIRSDNGVPFASVRGVLGLSRLSAWWVALGIDLERGRPGCPQDNGAHERLHGDVARELECEGGLRDRQARFEEWRQTFNYERPHEALGMRTPAEVYRPSARKYDAQRVVLNYPGMVERRILPVGRLAWKGVSIFVSHALVGWTVGLEPEQAGRWRVWFGRLLLGVIEPQTASFIRAAGASGHLGEEEAPAELAPPDGAPAATLQPASCGSQGTACSGVTPIGDRQLQPAEPTDQRSASK